jgi:hypothetical protein
MHRRRQINRKGFRSMLYGRGAVMSRQVQQRNDTASTQSRGAHLPATTGREDVAMLLRLCVVALLAVGAAAGVIAFAQ